MVILKLTPKQYTSRPKKPIIINKLNNKRYKLKVYKRKVVINGKKSCYTSKLHVIEINGGRFECMMSICHKMKI